jgi:hypothetical protein
MFVCNSNYSYYNLHYALWFFKFFKTIIIFCILTEPLYIYDMSNHYCIFLCWIPAWRWPKKADRGRRVNTCLYVIVLNYSAVIGIYMVTCHIFSVTFCLQQNDMYLDFKHSILTSPLQYAVIIQLRNICTCCGYCGGTCRCIVLNVCNFVMAIKQAHACIETTCLPPVETFLLDHTVPRLTGYWKL